MSSIKFGILVRSFSTSNVNGQTVKLPIQIFGLDGRYATALYSAASKQKALESVEKELVGFQKSLKTDQKLREFILNPTLKRSVKVQAFKEFSTKSALTPQTSNLLELLAENGRLRNLEGIINAYTTIMAAHRGEVTCEVISAKPLDAALKKQLETTLKSFVKPNEVIQLTSKVDPTIIGGLIVSIGDKYVDMSVSSKIKKYTDLISGAA